MQPLNNIVSLPNIAHTPLQLCPCVLCWNRDTIAEGIEGKQADLFEEIGVDTDEAAGITYQQMEQLLSGGRKAGAAAAGVKRARSQIGS